MPVKNISVFYFPTHEQEPRTVSIPAYEKGPNSIAVMDELFSPDNPTIQVYRSILFATDATGGKFKFKLAFQYDSRLPKNHSVKTVRAGTVWYGSMVVMKVKDNKYVDLSEATELKVAKAAVAMFLGIAYGRIQAAQSPLEIRFPSTVELEMQCE